MSVNELVMEMLNGQKILITGGDGFLARHVMTSLVNQTKYCILHIGQHSKVELTNYDEVDKMFAAFEPSYVIHLAGYNGNIQFNIANKFDIFQKNTDMALNVIKSCVKYKVKKMLGVVASCAYPEYEYVLYNEETWNKEVREEMCESGFFDGEPHITVDGHGYAKRNLQLACSFANQQYGLDAVCVCPTTIFGPGDNYDLAKTKVVGGLIRRFHDAKMGEAPSVTCWGSGKPFREFIYAKDAADIIVKAFAFYDDPSIPLNIGSGQELSIKELAATVAEVVGYKGEILWDTSKSDGQFRKRLDSTKLESLLPKYRFTPLKDALKETYAEFTRLSS